ncbi:MAG: acyltransferase [Bacteroidaceae bacterium]
MITSLSRRDSTFLKGLAICAIFLHNYCHWMPRCIPENEYSFTESNVQMLAHYFRNGGPHLFMNILSFFGHYGVPIFLFISGYGLVQKYERSNASSVSIGSFISYNVIKLWKLLVPAVLLFIGIHAFEHGWHIRLHWADVLYVLTFVSNLMPKHYNLLGPWWYFSLTLQLYIVYRLVFYRWRNRTSLLVAVGLCLLMQAIVLLFFDNAKHEVLHYLRYNFVGSMLPFLAGVWGSRYGFRLPVWSFLPSMILLILCSFNAYLWLLTPLFAIGIALPLASLLPRKSSGLWLWIGGLSASLFVVHPLVRPYFANWAKAAEKENLSIYPAFVGYIAACFFAAWLYNAFQTRLFVKKQGLSKKK